MKLGLMSAALPDLSLEQLCEWSSQNGFQAVELACWPKGKAERRYAGVCHADVDSLDQAKADAIRETIDCHGLVISSLAYYPNPLHADESHRKEVIAHLKKVIVAAERLSVSVVGTFAGRNKDLTLEENFKEFEKVWPEIVHFASDYGVSIAIENCPMIFSNDEWPGGNNLAVSPAVWRRMFEIIPDSNFGLNFDPSHLIWQFIDPVRAITEFGSKFLHVHAKDVSIDREGLYQNGTTSLGMGWQVPRLPGFGEVNWAQFFAALYAVGYDSVVSIEHEDRAFEATEELVKRGFLIARDVLSPYIH